MSFGDDLCDSLERLLEEERRAKLRKILRVTLNREAIVLQEIGFTADELAVFDARVAGIQERYRKVVDAR